MSFLLGQNKQIENIPGDITGLREGFANYLQTSGLSTVAGGGEESPFIAAMRNMFSENREQGLAQAKESAGNLTGSGFANTLGTTVNRSLSQENATIAQMMDAERARIMQTILGFGTAGVAPPSQVYQPGMLDMLAQFAGDAGPTIASMFTGAPPQPQIASAGGGGGSSGYTTYPGADINWGQASNVPWGSGR